MPDSNTTNQQTQLIEALQRYEQSERKKDKDKDGVLRGFFFLPHTAPADTIGLNISQTCVHFSNDINSADHYMDALASGKLEALRDTMQNEFSLNYSQISQVSDPNNNTLKTYVSVQPMISLEDSLQKIDAKTRENNTIIFKNMVEEKLKKIQVVTAHAEEEITRIHKELNPNYDPEIEEMIRATRREMQQIGQNISALQKAPLPTNILDNMQNEGNIYINGPQVKTV